MSDWYPSDPQRCLALADTIVVVHFAIVTFVIAGEAAVLLGAWRRWRWVGNRWFRGAHLLVILFVASQALFDRLCPLTIWELELRELGGERIEKAGFIARWLHELLFVEAGPTTLTVLYVAFALLVVGSLFLVPVRWRGRE
jgi:hypothetical protein